MARSTTGGGVDVDRVRAQLDLWRRTPGRGRGIPEEIWKGVVGLARAQGIYRVSRLLRLNYQSLQQRLASGGGNLPPKAAHRPVFLDLGTAHLNAAAGCVVDLVAPDGARMTVRLSASVSESLAALAAALWSRRG
jgi:hypothetical protein